MNSADSPPLNPAAAFTVLTRHQVEFVLVGGLAGQARGATRFTKDLDICPKWTPDNLERLAAALRELNARLKIEEGSIQTLEVDVDGRMIRGMEIGAWRTTAGDVDEPLAGRAGDR